MIVINYVPVRERCVTCTLTFKNWTEVHTWLEGLKDYLAPVYANGTTNVLTVLRSLMSTGHYEDLGNSIEVRRAEEEIECPGTS